MFRILHIAAMYLCVRSAFSLKCYYCDSDENVLCNEGGLASYLYSTVECHTVFERLFPPKCYKITAEGTDGSFHTLRKCVSAIDSFLCKNVVSSIGWAYSDRVNKLECETCGTDYCNLAERSARFTFLGVALAMAILIF